MASRIPQTLNEKAIEIAYKLRKKPVEYFQTLGIDGTISPLIKGYKGGAILDSSIKGDVLVHDHNSFKINGVKTCGGDVNTQDFLVAIKRGFTKIFASNEEKLSSMDFSDSILTKEQAIEVLKKEIKKTYKVLEIIAKKLKEGKTPLSELRQRFINFQNWRNETLAKKYNWMYEVKKWEQKEK